LEEQQPVIIIRKVKKRHNEGHHGGSWKVAYADFITALMAFFLLLWLISMVSPEKKIAVAQYFKTFSVMKESGSSFMTGSSQILDKAGGANSIQNYKNLKSKFSAKDIEQRLRSAIDLKLQAIKEQVMISIVDGGLKIQIIDKDGSLMFPLGSSEPTPKAKEILKIVSENTKDIPNKIIVEGHTDAAPFRSAQTTNWELSTARASAARRELENNSIDPGRIAKVIGYADQELLIPQNPMDARNRRISIIVIQPKQ